MFSTRLLGMLGECELLRPDITTLSGLNEPAAANAPTLSRITSIERSSVALTYK
jgi:hypothetical protein